MNPHRIAVVGAGVTGLTAAYYLQKVLPESEVIVLEAENQPGGKLITSPFAGFSVDEGADSFLARVPWGFDLCQSLGLDSELVSPSARNASLWDNEKLKPIPSPNVLGVPLNTETISDDFLPSEAITLLNGSGLPQQELPEGDLSVGQVVRSCVGDDVLERLVDPLLGGINAGIADAMSCAMMAPQLLEAARHPDGMLNHLRNLTRNADPNAPVFHAHPEGMKRLVDALVDSLGNSLKLNSSVKNISRSGSQWIIETAEEFESVDGIIIATPAFVASKFLETILPSAGETLGSIEFASAALVTFSFSRSNLEVDNSQSGFLVPRAAGLFMTACSYSGSKWAHLRHPEVEILRVSTGRINDDRHLKMSDDELVAELRSDLAVTLGVESQPVDVRITRWPNSLPQFPVGHVAAMEDLRMSLDQQVPGLLVAGAAHRGVGVPACIRSGKEAAHQMADFLYG